jgi:hypothetical protein
MKKADVKNEKRMVLDFEGIGKYVGEAGWTPEYTFRKATRELNLDAKAWGFETAIKTGDGPAEMAIVRKETKRTVTIKVVQIRKDHAPVEEQSEVAPLIGVNGEPIAAVEPDVAPVDDLVLIDLVTGAPVQGEEEEEPDPVTVTLNRSDLTEAVKVAVEVAAGGKSLPILSHLHLSASGGLCTISATNLETSWTRTINATVLDEVSVCVPAKVFFAEVRALPAEVREV